MRERPTWCPHPDCQFIRAGQGLICVGSLPAPVPHDGVDNTHRLCINAGEPVFDLQLNGTDAEWFRWMLDAVDGKRTSWLSGRRTTTTPEVPDA